MVVLTRLAVLIPSAARMAQRFFSEHSACSATPAGISPVCMSMPSWPEM